MLHSRSTSLYFYGKIGNTFPLSYTPSTSSFRSLFPQSLRSIDLVASRLVSPFGRNGRFAPSEMSTISQLKRLWSQNPREATNFYFRFPSEDGQLFFASVINDPFVQNDIGLLSDFATIFVKSAFEEEYHFICRKIKDFSKLQSNPFLPHETFHT